jgi:hypothetical protein
MGWVVNAMPQLPPGKRLGTHYKGGRVFPRDCLGGCRNPASNGIRSLNHPDLSESLYRVHFPSPNHMNSHDDITRFVSSRPDQALDAVCIVSAEKCAEILSVKFAAEALCVVGALETFNGVLVANNVIISHCHIYLGNILFMLSHDCILSTV